VRGDEAGCVCLLCVHEQRCGAGGMCAVASEPESGLDPEPNPSPSVDQEGHAHLPRVGVWRSSLTFGASGQSFCARKECVCKEGGVVLGLSMSADPTPCA
jgi:hypothetical protein